MTMQAFYTNLTSAQVESRFAAFVRIAHASLKEILAVRSELAWVVWTEAK
jgi:hypothetical protein